MRALVFDDGNLRYRNDVPRPVPQAGEALIRVRLAGICRTDLEITRGYMGFRGIPGHEFVGVVEACDDAGWVGLRVVGEINCGCGGCSFCRDGRAHHCPHRTVLGIAARDGALAEYLCLPVENLHAVPEQVPDEAAVFTEPLAAAFRIPEQVDVPPGERILVVGDGKLGLLIAQVMRQQGAEVTLIGHHRDKLSLVASQGIETLLEAEASRLPPAEMVVECSGTPAGLQRARAWVTPRGRLILKSTFASSVAIDLCAVVVDEVTLVGSRCGPFAPALAALSGRKIMVTPLISAVYPVEQGLEAFARARDKGTLKVLICFDEDLGH